MAANKPSESALLDLVDPGDDEINISSGNMNPNEDTFIDMNDDTEALLGPSTADLGDIDTPAKQESSVFSFGFYQRLFDVDTEDIVARLAWSALPRPKFTSNFAKDKIKSKPDLYGPFWICVTLIFSVAIAGNISNYFQYRFKAQEVPAKEGVHWHYNFHQVTWSATIVFAYATIVPSGLFGALWSNTPKDSQFKPSWIELVCIFGYCLAPFVPASVLWLIQISLVQWLVVLVSFVISGGVLALAIWPIVNEFSGNKSKSYILIGTILTLHLLLASGFMLLFFHVPNTGHHQVIENQHDAAKDNSTKVVASAIKTRQAPDMDDIQIPTINSSIISLDNSKENEDAKSQIHVKKNLSDEEKLIVTTKDGLKNPKKLEHVSEKGDTNHT